MEWKGFGQGVGDAYDRNVRCRGRPTLWCTPVDKSCLRIDDFDRGFRQTGSTSDAHRTGKSCVSTSTHDRHIKTMRLLEHFRVPSVTASETDEIDLDSVWSNTHTAKQRNCHNGGETMKAMVDRERFFCLPFLPSLPLQYPPG